MMKKFIFLTLALAVVSGCATSRRAWVPQQTTTTAGGAQPFQRGIVPQRPMVSPQVRQGIPFGQAQLGYGAPGMVAPPALFMSEYMGTSYDPRTHFIPNGVAETELARERARRSGMVTAPPPPRGTGCTNCASRDDLGAVMDEVDALRREVDRR